MSDYYTVVKGDTLSKIANEKGTTVSELQKLNNLRDPNKLDVGQRLALKKEVVLGFQPLFLDKNRDPIQGLKYKLEFNGKSLEGITAESGLGLKIFTDSVEDQIKVFVERLNGTFKEIGTVVSGYGNKLATFLSGSIKVEAKTEKHPTLKEGERPNRKEETKPAFDPKAKQAPTTDKKELGVKTKSTTTADGKPLTVVTGDIPDLSFLGEYVGGEITEDDIKAAAKELGCEAGLIYAIAKQESGKSSFLKIDKKVVPSILYERHWFSKLTDRVYDEKYHDISAKQAYHKTKKKKILEEEKDENGNKKEKKKGKQKFRYEIVDEKTGKPPVADDIYGSVGLPQYRRLVKAYQLDKNAALQSCSWGKFQIMGFNFKAAGYSDVFSFVKSMSSGDPSHIKAFLKFAKSNKILLNGLKDKNFEKIAEGHNGGSWRDVNPEYASNLERFYNDYKEKNK